MTDIDKKFLLAAEKGDALAVQELLDKGANVNLKDKNGLTVLMRASYRGDIAIVRILMDKGAYVHTKNSQGKTALIMAESRGQLEVARLLKQAKQKTSFKLKNISFIYYLIFCWLVFGWCWWYVNEKFDPLQMPYNLSIFILIFLGMGIWVYFSPKSYDGFVISGIEAMIKNIEKNWITIADVLRGFGKNLFDTSGLPFLFQVIKIILGVILGVLGAVLLFMSAIVLLVFFLVIYLAECCLTLLSNTVRFYYPEFNGNYFYNAIVAVMFLPPVYFIYDGILIPFIKKLGSFFAFCLLPFCDFYDWLMVGFFSVASSKRREARKALKEAKRREKEEAKKIKEALKTKAREEKKVERKNIPKLPATLDNKQIKGDINYLQTLPNKGYLIKYLGGIMDRFIAKGQAKTYQEIQKVIMAKTDIETALKDLEKATEDLIDAQESRDTAKENAEAKYLLRTLQAQFAVRKHRDEESLEDLRIETERKKLEAEREEAEKRKVKAQKEIADLQTPRQPKHQPKNEMDKFKEVFEKQVNKKKKRDMVDDKQNKDIGELEERAKNERWSFEKFEEERDLIVADWHQFSQDNNIE